VGHPNLYRKTASGIPKGLLRQAGTDRSYHGAGSGGLVQELDAPRVEILRHEEG
jgi:hypothetical protein